MKYQYSKEKKAKAKKRNRILISAQYGIGASVLISVLVNNWSTIENEIKFPLLAGLIILPFAWIYFDRKFRSKMSTTYEIQDDCLIIEENSLVKHKINLSAIRKLVKIPNGNRIETLRGTAYIPDGIENREELLQEIQSKANLS